MNSEAQINAFTSEIRLSILQRRIANAQKAKSNSQQQETKKTSVILTNNNKLLN